MKEIAISRYRDDQHILPTNNVVGIYRYSNAMLKHMPEKALKHFKTRCCTAKRLYRSKATTTEEKIRTSWKNQPEMTEIFFQFISVAKTNNGVASCK